VVAAFMALLGRPPEPAALARQAGQDRIETVLWHLAQSPEFLDRLTLRIHSGTTGGLRPIATERIVYLHIPKCGGTTLHHMLAGWYGADAVHRERLNGLYYHSAASLAAKQVFSGHYDFYSTGLVPGRPRLISFLRDPRERLISLYNFHRAHRPLPNDPRILVRWANQHDIDAYFADPAVRAHAAVDNTLARYFSDVPQVAHRWQRRGGPLTVPLEAMAEQALANLARFEFIGFMDRYQASVRQLAAQLGKPAPAVLGRHQALDEMMESNAGMRRIDKQRPSAATLAQMQDLIRFDGPIHAAAWRRFGPAIEAAGTAAG
jgi:hypothetical protein